MSCDASRAAEVPSPNIWHHPDDLRDREPGRRPRPVILEATMRRSRPGPVATVLDIGCGTGFHLPRFADDGRRASSASSRTRSSWRSPGGVPAGCRWCRVAQGLRRGAPAPDASVDVVHARWAYFFGPGCEPGLAELDRVVRRGGTAFVIDNDPTRSTFGALVPTRLPRPSTRPPSNGSGRRAAGPGHPVDIGWAFTVARRPRDRRPDRVPARPSPRRSSPSTRAPRSTTPSTSGRSAF